MINLAEYKTGDKDSKKFGIIDKNEGMEALLNSVHAYATHA